MLQNIMNQRDIKDHSPPCDSEVSVDYYVTTVNNCSTQNVVNDHGVGNSSVGPKVTVVVSIDQDSGVIKLRKRKKSKRRKKKCRSIQESELHASDDGILYRSSSSDSSERKVPRRSASLCDRYVKKTSTSESFNKILSDYRRGDRKRNFSKSAKTVTEHNGKLENSVLIQESVEMKSAPNDQKKHDSSSVSKQEKLQVSAEQNAVLLSSNEHLPGAVSKKLDRDDAIATLNAFMLEVEEATSVAKKREGEKKKESPLFESPSSEFNSESVLDVISRPVSLSPVPESISSTSPNTRIRRSDLPHSESVLSGGSVFFSETDLSTSAELRQPPNPRTGNSNSKEDTLLEMMLIAKVGNTSEIDGLSNRRARISSQSDTPKKRSADYGLAHLEQVCKLIEQIGDLRKQNQALVKQVHLLESEVKLLRKEKEFSLSDYSYPETYQTLNFPKRTRAVGRLKEAIAKSSRKISSDKFETKRNPQLLSMHTDSSDRISLSASTSMANFMPLSKEKTFSRSHMDLNLANRQRLYSHDDIEVDIKGSKWRFWKAPSKGVGRHHSNRLPKKYNVNDKSSTVIRRAFLTVDSLDSNVESSTTTSPKSSRTKPQRTSSRISDVSGGSFDRLFQSNTSGKPPKYDENLRLKNQQLTSETVVHKPSFREKLSKWEKNAARKLHRRSNSVDRTGLSRNRIDYSKQKNLSTNDIHKSMPCVAGLDEEAYRKKNSIISTSSNEWKSLQEAFPTKPVNGKPANGFRLPSAIRSRLTAPLRRKSSSKRKSWSFAKRRSGFYLPSADFSFGSSYDLTEPIGEQFTLHLNQDDVQSMVKTESEGSFTDASRQSEPVREKLNDMTHQDSIATTQESQDQQRPGSALARLRLESNQSDENNSKRARCPFFPSIKSRKTAASFFM